MLYFQLFDYFLNFYWKQMPLRCDTRFEKEKKSLSKGGIEPGSIASKKVLVHDLPYEPFKLKCLMTAVLCVIPPVHLVQSAVSHLFPNSNYTYLFRFVWFVCVFWLVVVFSDFIFCFRFSFEFIICYFVFRIVICFALLGHCKNQ